MDKQPKVSIIVAVYNAEKTLKRCIDSLLVQSFTDFEVLLINDGSTDESEGICNYYAAKDERFRVFHRENQGVASARQKGIDEAKGLYSIHVDSDDWVEPSMLSELYETAISSDVDVVLCDYYEDNGTTSIYREQYPEELSGDGLIRAILKGQLMGVLWNKLVRHELYKMYNACFVPGINHCEDVLMCMQLLLHDIKVSYAHNAFYHYDTTGTDSITRNYTVSTYDMRKRYIGALQSILPSSYQEHIDWAALQVKVGAFVNGVMTSREYKAYYPLTLKRILTSNHSPRIKVAFALANMGLFGIGKWFYRTYSALTTKKHRHRNILFWGDHQLNAGPSNVHRSLITHSSGELHYVKSHKKIVRYIELIWRCIKADVVIIPSFISSQDIRLIRMLCKKLVCISHGCLKQECVINNQRDRQERAEEAERLAFSSSKVVVCVSARHMQVLQSQYPEFAEKMTFVNNGVKISPRSHVAKIPYTIAVSGGNRNIKNNEYVCKAVQLLNDSGFTCKVNIFGRNYPECEDLTKFSCAEYMGQLERGEYYKRLDEIALFVIASELEPFGLVVADALNCHCSLLMSHNVGASAIMQTCSEDYVENPRDVDELARCIRHLLEHPNAERLLASVDVEECSEMKAWEKLKVICYNV